MQNDFWVLIISFLFLFWISDGSSWKFWFFGINREQSYALWVFSYKQEKLEGDEVEDNSAIQTAGGKQGMNAVLFKDLEEWMDVTKCVLCPEVQLSKEVG